MVRVEGRHHGTKAGIGQHFSLGIVGFQRGVLSVDLGLRLRQGRAWFKPGNHMLGVSA